MTDPQSKSAEAMPSTLLGTVLVDGAARPTRPSEEHLLEQAQTQWHFGDWERLAQLPMDILQGHPDRSMLVLLAGVAKLQLGQQEAAKECIRLSIEWGIDRRFLVRTLISGVYNSLGRAVAGEDLQGALKYFHEAIILGVPNCDVPLLTQARTQYQSEHLCRSYQSSDHQRYYQGYPISEFRARLSGRVEHRKVCATEKTPRLKVVTVVSDIIHFGYCNYLVPSAQFYGIELETLLADEVRISRKTGCLAEKDRLLLAHLDGRDDDSIVMFLDGYDTVILCHQEEIIDKFKSYNAGLVVSAEVNCHPDDSLATLFPETQYSAKYLNTGGFIGYAHAVRKVIDLAQAVVVPDNRLLQLSNQYRWTRVFLENPDLLKLDNCSKLFMSASTKKESRDFTKFAPKYSQKIYEDVRFAAEELDRVFTMFSAHGNRIVALESHEHPCVLHWNGPGALFMETHADQFDFLRPWLRQKSTEQPT